MKPKGRDWVSFLGRDVAMKHTSVTLLGAGLLVFSGLVWGQDTAAKKGSAERMRAGGGADHAFAMKAAQGGQMEVDLGKMAKDHASSQAVKDFGQRMVDDHSKAGDELKALASKKSIDLPSGPGAEEKGMSDRLGKLQGAAFDRAYMRMMVSDHKKDIAEFQREANRGQDADLKTWAAKTLPTLQEHLAQAQKTWSEVNK
jgi:putative membrane protein